MESLIQSPFVAVALTLVVFAMARQLQKRMALPLLNPVLVTIVILVCLLSLSGVDYDTYAKGGQYIDFWLKPAVVALGFPCINIFRPYVSNGCPCCLPNWPDASPA